ncbi:DUF4438 domain-containing protein [Calditrichota bacterium]
MAKFKSNRDQLVEISVIGEISSPITNVASPYRMNPDGESMIFPGVGGITFNKRIGDSAIDLWGDHIEPAVSIKNYNKDFGMGFNGALNILACIGNRAEIISGDAKGTWGRVTGQHGGIEHVMVDFTEEQMQTMTIGDRVQVRAYGTGYSLTDYPGVKLRNIDPALLDVMPIKGKAKNERLQIPVTHRVPSKVMGSGLGKTHVNAGDYDIQMFDEATVEEYGLNSLRFGDIVGIIDADNTYGRIYLQNAISVGVIVHSRSVLAGHGPGVATMFTSKEGLIDLVIDKNANLKNYFAKLGDPAKGR